MQVQSKITEKRKIYNNLKRTIREAGNYAAKHPGCARLSIAMVRIMSLQTFLDAAKEIQADPGRLNRLAQFVAIGYSTNESGVGENDIVLLNSAPKAYDPFEDFKDTPNNIKAKGRSQYQRAVKKDLQLCSSGQVNLNTLLKIEKNVQKLEMQRDEILAVARLIAPAEQVRDEDGILIEKLSKRWTQFGRNYIGFQRKFGNFLGNIFFAAKELKKSVINPKNKPILLKDLPARLKLRAKDYTKGRRLEKQRVRGQKPVFTISFEDVSPKERKEFISTEGGLNTKAELDLVSAKLSPAETRATEKKRLGYTLNPADRKAWERVRKKFKGKK